MKAVVLEKFGRLNYRHLPTPKPKGGEVLVKVKACALNRLDLWLRKGAKGASKNILLPHILGSDVAGVEVKTGKEVVINPALPQGVGKPVGIFGYNTWGGYAEYVVAPLGQVYSKPKNLSFVEAAAFPLTFLTAWRMLTTKAKLQKGETVFIWGASGGLGLAAIKIAKYLDAKVIAAAKTRAVAAKLKQLGADKNIGYPQGRVVEKVKALTNGAGVEVVFESVGKKTWQDSLNLLGFNGRVVIAGTTSGDVGSQDLSQVYYRQLTIFGSRMGDKKEFEEVLRLVNQGKLKPVIDKVFLLKDAIKAQARMAQGKHLGKIVLKV